MVDQTAFPSEVIAIAFVVEGSLTIANEWRHLLVEYIGIMMRRLTETHPKYAFRIAFVTYSSSDSLSSPLLCKRFFTDYTQVVKVMKDEAMSLGLGQTQAGPTKGMAVLEGLVAAIELFDDLVQSLQDDTDPSSKRIVKHVIHIASTIPDQSPRPLWNISPELDEVSWDTLPEEFKKRKIHYNAVILRQPIPKFTQLSQFLGNRSQPWFPTKPTHTVLLSGFPAPSQQKGPAKRVNEGADRPIDPKRARLAESPQSALSTPSNAPKPDPKPSPAQQTPATHQQPFTNDPSKVTPAQRQAMLEKIKTIEAGLSGFSRAIDESRKAGRMEEAAQLAANFKRRHEMILQLKQTLITAQAASNANNGSTGAKMASPASNIPPTSSPMIPQSTPKQPENPVKGALPMILPKPANEPPAPAPPAPTQRPSPNPLPNNTSGNNFTPSNSNPPPPPPPQPTIRPTPSPANQPLAPPPPNFMGVGPKQTSPPSADMQAQFAKLMDQRNRQPPMHPMPIQQQQSLPPNFPNTSVPRPPMPNNPSGGPSGASIVWEGQMKWNGMGNNNMRKEVTCRVLVLAQNPSTCLWKTWPPHFSMVPTRDSSVTAAELQAWIALHKPILCPVTPDQRVQDSQNLQNYQSFVGLLASKEVYATAAWTTPSGGQTNNVLFFPHQGRLVGAFFPLTGIPEMPKMSTIGNGPGYPMSMASRASGPSQLPQQMVSQQQKTQQQQQQHPIPMQQAQLPMQQQLPMQLQAHNMPPGVPKPSLQTAQIMAHLNSLPVEQRGQWLAHVKRQQALHAAGVKQGGMNVTPNGMPTGMGAMGGMGMGHPAMASGMSNMVGNGLPFNFMGGNNPNMGGTGFGMQGMPGQNQ